MKKINEKLFIIYSDCQVKYFKIINEYEKKIKDSLINKKENIKKYLDKSNYKEIINEIDKEINDNLEELNNKIQEFLENTNSEIDEINKMFINTIHSYSGEISIKNLQSFKDYFSIKVVGKEADLAKEIFKEIKLSTLNLENIYEEKGFKEWIKSPFSTIKYFQNSLDIILNSFSKKIDYIIYLIIEELTKFIEKAYKDFNEIYKICTKYAREISDSFNQLQIFYEEQKHKINNEKKLIKKIS